MCGEFSVETENIFLSPEDEIFLPIKVFHNEMQNQCCLLKIIKRGLFFVYFPESCVLALSQT